MDRSPSSYLHNQSFFSFLNKLTEALFFIGLALFLLSPAVLPSLRKIFIFEIALLMFIGFCFPQASLYFLVLVFILLFGTAFPSMQDQLDFFIQILKKPKLVLF